MGKVSLAVSIAAILTVSALQATLQAAPVQSDGQAPLRAHVEVDNQLSAPMKAQADLDIRQPNFSYKQTNPNQFISIDWSEALPAEEASQKVNPIFFQHLRTLARTIDKSWVAIEEQPVGKVELTLELRGDTVNVKHIFGDKSCMPRALAVVKSLPKDEISAARYKFDSLILNVSFEQR